jgi:hypothetical protein
MTTTDPTPGDPTPLLRAMLNVTTFHREHEKYYSTSLREQAVALQRHSRTLHALADRWTTAAPATRVPLNPYEAAPDLNDLAAVQLDGVLFLEGGSEPGEIAGLRRDLRSSADEASAAGEWLGQAMQSSWDLAPALFDIDELSDLLGERHRIIANNWQGAGMMRLTGRILLRAADLLDRVDFRPGALREDLAGPRVAAPRLASAAEMIDHAADLLSDFASLEHDNERRWRVVRTRVEELLQRRDGAL